MLTIEPPPASRIAAPKTWMAWKAPTRLTSRVPRNASVGTSSMRWGTAAESGAWSSAAPVSGGWSMPAPLTSPAGGPSSSTRSRTARSEALSVTSARSSRKDAPRLATASASSPAPRAPTSMPTTSAPAPASALTRIGPSFPSGPVTIPSAPWSERACAGSLPTAGDDPVAALAIPARDSGCLRQPPLADVVLGQRRIARERLVERATDELVEPRWRNAVGGRLGGQVLLAQDVRGGEIAGRNELLGHLEDRLDLALVAALLAAAQRHVDPAQVANHLPHALRLERERVVGAAHGAVEGEVLLDDARAQCVGDHGHRDAVVVAGQPDHGPGELVAEGLDHPQV